MTFWVAKDFCSLAPLLLIADHVRIAARKHAKAIRLAAAGFGQGELFCLCPSKNFWGPVETLIWLCSRTQIEIWTGPTLLVLRLDLTSCKWWGSLGSNIDQNNGFWICFKICALTKTSFLFASFAKCVKFWFSSCDTSLGLYYVMCVCTQEIACHAGMPGYAAC